MLNTPVTYHITFILPQWPPATVEFQLYSNGRHMTKGPTISTSALIPKESVKDSHERSQCFR